MTDPITMPAEPEQARVWTYDDHSSEWVEWDRNGRGEWERRTGMARTSHKWTDVLLSGPVHLSDPKPAGPMARRPRPWGQCTHDPEEIVDATGETVRDMYDSELAAFVVRAVNAYDPDRDALNLEKSNALNRELGAQHQENRRLHAALSQASRERDAAQESADQLRRAIARVTDNIIVRSDESLIRSIEDLRIEHDNRGSERDMRSRELSRVAEALLALEAKLERQCPVIDAARKFKAGRDAVFGGNTWSSETLGGKLFDAVAALDAASGAEGAS